MASSTKMTIAVSARALFDFEAENLMFREDDPSAYCALQAARLDIPASPGVAFPLVRKLLAFNCGESNDVDVAILSRKLEAEARMSDLHVIGVKEKLGSLRVYLRGAVADRVLDWVATAEGLSRSTCERCSQSGVLRGNKDGQIRTLCPTCAEATAYTLE